MRRSRAAPHRAVQRAGLVLLAADGVANTVIAKEVGLSRATVVKWPQRFAQSRMAGGDPPGPRQPDGARGKSIPDFREAGSC
ncbi:MAG: helix-turn-helix domain-containing protein [Chloroflexi bacterium]|nr:helix-turn-helix domain-containing protein [Chloroflexota bacterium]